MLPPHPEMLLSAGDQPGTVADGAAGSVTSSRALARLRGFLESEGLSAGDRLPPERALAERLGLGRRALRRALEVLEAEGALWRRQGAGTFLGQPDAPPPAPRAAVAATNFLEIMEVRLRIEPQLAQLAALRARPEAVTRMQRIVDHLAGDGTLDDDARELWDGALHRLIAQSAGNALFLSLFDMVNRVRQDPRWQAIRARARAGQPTPGATRTHHAEIVSAIAAHDPQRAGEAMRMHLLYLQEVLIRQTSLDRVPDLHPERQDLSAPQTPESRKTAMVAGSSSPSSNRDKTT